MDLTVDQILATVRLQEPSEKFSAARYPFAYAVDFIRQHPEIIPSDVILTDRLLIETIRRMPKGWSHAEASSIREHWAVVKGYDQQEFACLLANAYLRLNGIARPDAKAVDSPKECTGAALAERVRIVHEIRAMADKIRAESWTPTAGIALGSVVDSVADMVNTLPEEG